MYVGRQNAPPDPVCMYTVSQKKQDTKLLPITLPNIG